MLLLLGGAGIVNIAPVVNAGSDATANVGIAITLAGSVTDDGLPSGTLTSLWTQDSGPGTATFVDATSPTTDVEFDIAGTYVLRLTGDDTALTAFDTMTVVVSATMIGGSDWLKWVNLLWH